ncbi:hypothetical protein CEXT_283981 [Caerostris extrusa]|uniref:Uncharacterized protein n=1 Tax=Caerostris extrusa TaxID=172846 RepID=A0AAV4Y3Q7_CAEEX|nr:hypothetical protein CEXT_283981 [Caerostris extrusa]
MLEVYLELFGISIRITNKKRKVQQTKGTHPNQKMHHLCPPLSLPLLDRFDLCLWDRKAWACNCGLENDSSKVFFCGEEKPNPLLFDLFNNETNGRSRANGKFIRNLFLGISIGITNKKKERSSKTKGTHPNQKMHSDLSPSPYWTD